jgi:hypothetical protein
MQDFAQFEDSELDPSVRSNYGLDFYPIEEENSNDLLPNSSECTVSINPSTMENNPRRKNVQHGRWT